MIVSSHILPELEDLADRFAVMVDGRWAEVAPGRTFFTRDDLRTGFGGAGTRRRLVVEGSDEAVAKARAALDAAGVPFEETAVAADLNETVLAVLHGGMP